MNKFKEFKINKYLTLKLEKGKTQIYIGGEKFTQCFRLLIRIPQSRINDYETINSIDEAARINKESNSLEETQKDEKLSFSSREEFWGHCSNLQVWYEHNYDTRLLHSNLAFPLLKKLSEIGDTTAIKIYKEEVVNRILEGNKSVVEFLIEGGYLDNFSKEELHFIGEELLRKIKKEDFRDISLYLNSNFTKFITDEISEKLNEQISLRIRKGNLDDVTYFLKDHIVRRFSKKELFQTFKSVDMLNIKELLAINEKGVSHRLKPLLRVFSCKKLNRLEHIRRYLEILINEIMKVEDIREFLDCCILVRKLGSPRDLNILKSTIEKDFLNQKNNKKSLFFSILAVNDILNIQDIRKYNIGHLTYSKSFFCKFIENLPDKKTIEEDSFYEEFIIRHLERYYEEMDVVGNYYVDTFSKDIRRFFKKLGTSLSYFYKKMTIKVFSSKLPKKFKQFYKNQWYKRISKNDLKDLLKDPKLNIIRQLDNSVGNKGGSKYKNLKKKWLSTDRDIKVLKPFF